MFRVILHSSDGEKKEYSTALLQYAKRYADLYKDDYPFVEIILIREDGSESIYETFGAAPVKQNVR